VSFTYDGGSPAARVEPVTLDMAKDHIRNLTTNDDDLLTAWIATARGMFEDEAGRQIINATREYALDAVPWHRSIELPYPPLAGDVVITYDDADGVEQTFDAGNYVVEPSFINESSPPAIDPHCRPGRVRLATGASWPTTSCEPGSLRIRRTCGYGATPSDVPGAVLAAIYLLIGHFYRNRSEVAEAKTRGGFEQIPLGAQSLINQFKWSALVTLPLGNHHHPWR
jgi:uncharacterized phiE125 gp8 family phage protein